MSRSKRPEQTRRKAMLSRCMVDLIEQLEGLAPRPVHLVDEGEDRDAPHAADLEQLAGLGLEALGRVFQHHRVVGGGEGAVGVFEKSWWPGVSSRLIVLPRSRTAARWR
jgi:hypothetical protein